MKRNFEVWMSKLRESIATWDYYVDFEKVYKHTKELSKELNVLNTLVGSKNIEEDFKSLLKQNPETLKAMPILIAKREKKVTIIDKEKDYYFDFEKLNYQIDEYAKFMRKTGLFRLLEMKILGNICDYVTGIEVGMDTNTRKNRTGHIMEDIVEGYLIDMGLVKGVSYFKEMKKSDIQAQFKIDLSKISNENNAEKRYDFVIYHRNKIYAIEVNFYSGGGTKLNETARSYKTLALESFGIPNFAFVWITDGVGWKLAKNNLEETFQIMDNIFSLCDLQNGALRQLIES